MEVEKNIEEMEFNAIYNQFGITGEMQNKLISDVINEGIFELRDMEYEKKEGISALKFLTQEKLGYLNPSFKVAVLIKVFNGSNLTLRYLQTVLLEDLDLHKDIKKVNFPDLLKKVIGSKHELMLVAMGIEFILVEMDASRVTE